MDFVENMLYDWVSHFVKEIYQPLDSTVTSWLYVGKDGAHFAEIVGKGGFCENVFNSLTIFAGVLLLIYLFTSLTDKVMKELASTQVAIKSLMELLVASVILLHGYTLISGFACLGDNIIDFINDGSGDANESVAIMQQAANDYNVVILHHKNEDGENVFTAPYAKTLRKQVGNTNNTVNYFQNSSTHKHKTMLTSNFNTYKTKWKDQLGDGVYVGSLFKLLVFNLVSMIIKVAAIAAAVGRLIQLAVYICLSPLAIVNVFGEGMHSQGIRYFKKVFACSLQGPAMALVIMLSAKLSVMDSVGPFVYIAVQIATLMALFKASSFANDVVL